MRDHSSHLELSRDAAIQLLLDAAQLQRRTELLPLEEAYGRVLAEDAIAQLDMPNCLTCCMDSVAVHWSDFAAGMPDTSAWVKGRDWEFANTGIGMPEGFDTAIVIEHVQLSPDLSSIAFDAAPSAQYAGCIHAGSKMHQGDVLVAAGSELSPLLLSLIASGNNTHVRVYAKPVVAFIPTGNELQRPGQELPRGKNIESNSLIAVGKIRSWGGVPKVWDIVPDSPELIKQALLEASRQADIVVLNAGSSKGSDDWNIEMLEELGSVLYHETNHGPGHHSSGALLEGTPVVGISGPPGGASFSMDFYLYPLMRAFFNLPNRMETRKVRLASSFGDKHSNKHQGKAGEVRPSIVGEGKEFFAVKQLQLKQDPDSAEIVAVPAPSSHLKPVQADSMDCYYMLSSLQGPLQAGDLIDVELRPR